MVGAAALLPLRFFFGFTFLYAGIDKVALDTTFLDLSSRTSILQQLEGYARTSPLAPLVSAIAVPNAGLMGFLIALAEIAVGIGVLTGLAFRAAAVGGAILSFLFFLTASWTVHPYYYGQDLPYALGFVTLAAAGHADLLVAGPWLERQFGGGTQSGRRGSVEPPISEDRRRLLQAGAVGFAAIVLAVVSRPLRDLLLPASASNGSGLAGLGASAAASAAAPAASVGAIAPAASSAPAQAGSAAGAMQIATVSQVSQQGAAQFTVPTSIGYAQQGDPGIIVALGSGKFAAFDAVCTHAGCTVGWDGQAGLLVCPCHGAAFDPHNNAQPVSGPTNIPLTELPIAINGSTGVITVKA